ncbi:hypothetical protein ACT3N0_09315 [Citrobacter portucalensis]|nr:hypothetical protein [Citrobacter sp. Cpo107]MDM2808607.1 hypothetical protein [Citrobacter sp. Cpo107]
MLRIILKFSLIAVGFLAGPGVIFLLPYIMPADSYANFAKVLTFSQMLALVSGLGLEIAGARFNIAIVRVTKIILLTTSISSVLLFIIFPGTTSEEKLIVWCIAFTTVLSTVYQSYFLFRGQALIYGLYGLLRSSIMLVSLIILLKWKFEVVLSYGIATIIGFSVSLLLVNKNIKVSLNEKDYNFRCLIKASMPFFIINGVAVLPIILDRLMAQQNLAPTEFSKYIVVTTWAVPIMYIGNIYQQFIISHFDLFSLKALIKKNLILLVVNTTYIIFVIAVTHKIVKVPYFKSSADFVPIWFLVSGWYTLYSAFAFPAAAYVQRRLEESMVQKLAWWTAGLLPLALSIAYFTASNQWSHVGMFAAAIFSSIFASLILVPRIFFVQRDLTKNVSD